MNYITKKVKNIPIFVPLLLCSFMSDALADSAVQVPGILVTGLYGNVSSGFADALIPVFGPINNFLFLDPQGFFHSKNEYSLSLGGGYRTLQENFGVLGAYVFADYNRSGQNNQFWFVSPGVQRLGEKFDISANIYIPVSRTKINGGQTFADNVGIDDYVSFSGHDQIDQLVDTFESTGLGADAEIGVKLPFLKNNSKIYFGSYYFAPKDNDSIIGGSARVNVPLNRFLSLTASESYDNVMHNTVKAGLSIVLGGRDSGFYQHGDLQARMLDAVQRNLAAMAGGAHTTQPVQTGVKLTGTYAVERSNIWFFTPDGAAFNSSGCTADSPCAFTQDAVNEINVISPNANFYTASGQYNSRNLTLDAGQSLYGRSANFTSAAANKNLPVFSGSLELQGDNYLERIKLWDSSNQPVGIMLGDNAQNVVINDVSIDGYQTGVQLGNNNSLTLQNSSINADASSSDTDLVAGIKLDNVSNTTVNIANTKINVSAGDNNVNLAGIFIGNDQTAGGNAQNNTVTLSHDQINVSANANAKDAFGVYLGNYFTDNSSLVSNNQLTILDSQINASAVNGHGFGLFIGNFEYMAPVISDNNVTVKNSSINASSENGCAYGVFEGMFNGVNTLAVNNNLLISNSQISATSNQGDAYGLELDGYNSNFTLTNNVITATALTEINYRHYVYGIDLQGGNDVLNISGNRIISQGGGDNMQVVGIGEGLFYSDLPGNNVVNSQSNVIIAQSESGSATVSGVLIQDQGASINMQNDVVIAESNGRGAVAVGINIAGANNTIQVEDSHIQAVTTGLGATAIGISASNGERIYGPSVNNMITLKNDNIWAISQRGFAFGISDPANNTNQDVWNIDYNTQIIIKPLDDSTRWFGSKPA
jgi:hypothetical protein